MKVLEYLTCCLAVAVMTSHAARLRRSAESTLNVEATPPMFIEDKTDELTLDCRVEGGPSDAMPIYILLSRVNELGTINMALQMLGRTDILDEDERTTAEGAIGEKEGDETYLTLKITEPEDGDAGEYVCNYLYLSPEPISLTESVNVSMTAIPSNAPVAVPEVEEEDEDCCQKNAEEIEKLKALVAVGGGGGDAAPANGTCQVGFSAGLKEARGYALRSNKVIAFDMIIANRGAAYDADSGIFTAPCSGQYYFSLTLTALHSTSGTVEGVIRRGEKKQARSFTSSSLGYGEVLSGSTSVLLTLEQGETVDVLLMASSSGDYIGEDGTVFSGYYLFP